MDKAGRDAHECAIDSWNQLNRLSEKNRLKNSVLWKGDKMPKFIYNRKSFKSHGYEIIIWDLSAEGVRDRLEIKPINPLHLEVEYIKSERYGIITLPAGAMNTDDIPDLIENLENVRILINELNNSDEIQKLNIL